MRDDAVLSTVTAGGRDEHGIIGTVGDGFVEMPGDQDLGGAERPHPECGSFLLLGGRSVPLQGPRVSRRTRRAPEAWRIRLPGRVEALVPTGADVSELGELAAIAGLTRPKPGASEHDP
jgi:hypothetical protein